MLSSPRPAQPKVAPMSQQRTHHRSAGFEQYIANYPGQAAEAEVKDFAAQLNLGSQYYEFGQGCYQVIKARTECNRLTEAHKMETTVFCPICARVIDRHKIKRPGDFTCAQHILGGHPDAIFGEKPHPITTIQGSQLHAWATSTDPDVFLNMTYASRQRYIRKDTEELIQLMYKLDCQRIEEVRIYYKEIDVSELTKFIKKRKKSVLGDDGLIIEKSISNHAMTKYLCVLRIAVQQLKAFTAKY